MVSKMQLRGFFYVEWADKKKILKAFIALLMLKGKSIFYTKKRNDGLKVHDF